MLAKPSVFISYRRKTAADLAGRIYDRLKRVHGYDTFLDVETINGGRFANIIRREIINRDVFVVILTPDTLESEWVVREIKTALDEQKPIIPLMAQGFSFATPLPDEIKDMGNYDAVRWDHDFADAAFERLVKAIDPAYGQVIPSKPKTGISSEIKVAIIGGIFVVIAAAIGILPSVLSPVAVVTPTTAQIMAVPSNTPSPTDTVMLASETSTASNPPTPTVVIQPSTTATKVIDSGATATEAILQRTVIAQEATNAALMTENAHFVQTITATLTPSSSPTLSPTPRSTSGLVVGGTATVRLSPGYNNLSVRSAPARDGLIRTELLEGIVVTIVDGPVAADSTLWWKVRTLDDIEGWVVEATGNRQNIVPLSASQISGTATTLALPTTIPTHESSATQFPTITTTQVPTSTSVSQNTTERSYPCYGEIVVSEVSQLYVLRAYASSRSPVLDRPVEAGSKITILTKEQPKDVWYEIAMQDGQQLGWIPEGYVIPSEMCPD